MSLCLEKIERFLDGKRHRSRKWLKNQRNRKIRRYDKTEIPRIKNKGCEY